MKIDEIMKRNVKVCRQGDNLNSAAQLMWDNDCGCVPVLASDGSGKIVGVITDRDICMAAYTRGKLLKDLDVEAAMAGRIVCCRPDDELSAAMTVMREKHVRRLPVIGHDGALAGILSLDDIAYEAGQPLRGGTNYQLREQVADVFIAISHGRVSARPLH